MPEARLFVGNLGCQVDEEALRSKLSSFVSVCSVNLKEKTDPDGNVLLRFAYVNIESSPSQITNCIHQLNGARWMGSNLRVEPAKESFLDRLNRERAAAHQQRVVRPEKIENSSSKPKKKNNSDLESQFGRVTGAEENHKTKKKRKSSDEQYQDKLSVYANDVHTREGEEKPNKREKKRKSLGESGVAEKRFPDNVTPESKKKNVVEENMMSSFKNFSSVWADSDSESNEDKGTVCKSVNNLDYGIYTDQEPSELVSTNSSKETESKRKESTPQNNDKVDNCLSNGQGSSGFSFLAQFSKIRKEVKIDSAAVIDQPFVTHEQQVKKKTFERQVKKKSFFLQSNDDRIEESIVWLTQSLTEDIRREFEEVQPILKNVFKLRSLRETRDKKPYTHGKNKGTSKRNTSNPHQDRRRRNSSRNQRK